MTKDELLDRAMKATTGIDLWRLMLEYCDSQGIERVSYHHHGHDARWGSELDTADPEKVRDVIDDVVVSANPSFHIAAHGFPRDWVESYVNDKFYEIDPIPDLVSRSTDPILWSDAKAQLRLAEEQSKFIEALDAQDIGDGVAIQVFGPNMRNGYVGFGFGKNSREITPAKLAEFQLVAQLMHLRACALIEARNEAEAKLSPRELEVLTWMARGKSKSVIADILEISVHTVDTNVRRIFQKLDVSDRTTAILKAITVGLIPAMALPVT